MSPLIPTQASPADPYLHDQIVATLSQPFGSFPGILTAWARAQPDQIALVDYRRDIAWAELIGLVERLAARLVETGLERGQSVAILGTSSVEYALVFLAAVRAGGVAAPLTTSASAQQLEGMASDCGARHLFIDAAKAAQLGPDFMADLIRVPLEDVDGWMSQAGSRAPIFEPTPKDAFNIIYSSGTTGIPSRKWGETPAGFVVLSEGDPEAILSAVNTRLGKTQRLSALYAIDEMPRSHIGKLLKTELREQAVRLADDE